MSDLPEFNIFGENDSEITNQIQPELGLRDWSDLSPVERGTVYRELVNRSWIRDYSPEILYAIEYLNVKYLRRCPGKQLHQTPPEDRENFHRLAAARSDFQNILITESESAVVLVMLSAFAKYHIDGFAYKNAAEAKSEADRDQFLTRAFKKFDSLANLFNYLFEQFAVNQYVTRNGFVPRQDERFTAEIYSPTLKILSDPKWKSVSDDLGKMFDDYRAKNYPEVITKAHSSLQRFLQILVGEEGRNGKGELAQLFADAKQKGILPANRFTEPVVKVIQGFVASERAMNSTAKPSLSDATPAEALLVMNVVMIFLQFCLQNGA